MRIIARLVLLAIGTSVLAACVSHGSGDPYPVTSNSPNPAPVPGYRVRCQSGPAPIVSVFDSVFVTGCQQIIPPADQQVVIRARG